MVWMWVTGSPVVRSTRDGKSSLSHFEARIGSVETINLVEVAEVHRVFDGGERVAVADGPLDAKPLRSEAARWEGVQVRLGVLATPHRGPQPSRIPRAQLAGTTSTNSFAVGPGF